MSQRGSGLSTSRSSKLRQGVRNNYPEALPDEDTATPVYGVGSLYAPSPVAISVQTPPALKEAVVVMGKKLTHALYLRESGNRLTAAHSFLSSVYQPQQGGTETLTTYFASLLPDQTIGERSNIKDYGDQFRYISGFKPEQDFSSTQPSLAGAILWGIVRGPNIPLPDGEPLRSAPWIRGAYGAGATALTA